MNLCLNSLPVLKFFDSIRAVSVRDVNLTLTQCLCFSFTHKQVSVPSGWTDQIPDTILQNCLDLLRTLVNREILALGD